MAVLLPEGKQSFETSAGLPLVGGKVYTYVPGTSTPKDTYTTSAASVANTNPVILDSRGEATIFWSGAYDVVLKTSADVTVWGPIRHETPESSGAAAAVLSDLSSTSDAAKGDALIGVKRTATGAVATTQHAANENRSLCVKTDFAAVGDGSTDDTAAIQAAITAAGAAFDADWFSTTNHTTPRIVDFPTAAYKISGTKLLVPRGVILRGNGSVLIGSGNTVSDNVCFETAYFSGASLVTNVGTSPETHRVQFSKIQGFKFRNFKQAFNLFNFNEGCEVLDCAFFNCYQNVYADRSWYSRFVNLGSREATALAASTAPAYQFLNFVNAMTIESVMCTNRVLGMKFSGGVNSLALKHVSIEAGTNGIEFDDNVNPMDIDSCYFEALTGIALDFTSGGGTNAITIDNNWFHDCATCISGANMLGGLIGRGNYYSGTITTRVSITDNVSAIKVELPFLRTSSTAGSLRPALPSGYSFGKAVWVDYPVQNYTNATGITEVQQSYSGGLTPLPFSGKQGFISGKVAFCDHAKTAGTTFDVTVDTKIEYDGYLMAIFSITIVDNISSYRMDGRTCGTTVYADAAAGKTITASNTGGYLRLTFSSFSHPSSTYTCEGIVRMV